MSACLYEHVSIRVFTCTLCMCVCAHVCVPRSTGQATLPAPPAHLPWAQSWRPLSEDMALPLSEQLATILAHTGLSRLICEVVSARPTGVSSWALSGQGVFSPLACRSHGEQAAMLPSGEHTQPFRVRRIVRTGSPSVPPRYQRLRVDQDFPPLWPSTTLLPIASLHMTSTCPPPPPESLPELTATSAPVPVHSHAGFLQGNSDPHRPQRKPLEPMLAVEPSP